MPCSAPTRSIGTACWPPILTPQFVTFINPSLQKGAYAFVRIAHELGRRRPDIPLLVVESRGTRDTLMACGLDLGLCGNVRFMANTSDPRRFWGVTRIALMPSLCCENQPLVVVEAMINGIPVIASDRGGTPEALGDCGFALPLPERMTPMTHILPTAEEVEPWVEAIIRLWDDPALYEEQSVKARAEAQRWHPDRLRPLYAEFFSKAQVQPRPPIMSQASGRSRLPHLFGERMLDGFRNEAASVRVEGYPASHPAPVSDWRDPHQSRTRSGRHGAGSRCFPSRSLSASRTTRYSATTSWPRPASPLPRRPTR